MTISISVAQLLKYGLIRGKSNSLTMFQSNLLNHCEPVLLKNTPFYSSALAYQCVFVLSIIFACYITSNYYDLDVRLLFLKSVPHDHK